MTETTGIRLLSRRAACGWALVAVAAFHLAYLFEAAGGLIVLYLGALFALAWVPSSRWAFYLGLAIGIAIAGPQLWFFQGIFGPAACALWAVLGVWLGLFLLLAHQAVVRWPTRGAAWIPIIWLGFEYARSELYYLKFAWLTPGFALSHPAWLPWAHFGMYGFSFWVLISFAIAHRQKERWRRARELILPLALLWGLGWVRAAESPAEKQAPYVVGIQTEGALEFEIVEALERVAQEREQVDLLVLSEYAFDGPIPESIRDWCRQHRKHLIAGGKDSLDGGTQYHNAAFVVSPEGEIVFRQVKAVPVQLMADGLPATEQNVWNSPWGKIGIAICYDLSYARVMDRLIEAGAQGLIVPTMDNEEWGAHERWLHAKVAPVRAREYGVPIFRLASSGISQFVNAQGDVLSTAPYPGPNARIEGRLGLGAPGRRPLDRYLAIPAVIATAGLWGFVTLRRGTMPRTVRPHGTEQVGAELVTE